MIEQSKEKSNAVESALTNIQKKYGKASIIKMDEKVNLEVDVVPTGCLSLDNALSCGGLPRGRIIELFGEESSGKSTLSLFFISQIQKMGGKAAFVDAEFAFNSEYAKNIGVNIDDLIVSQPETLEEAIDIVDELVKSNGVDIVVVDSVASLVPKEEREGAEMLKTNVAMQARLMNQALRILTANVSKSKTIVIFINQVRDKIGVFFGNKTSTPGGKALKFYSSLRVEVKKGQKIEENGEQVGNWMNISVVKNKVGNPWRKASFELLYKRGVDLYGDAFDFAVEKGIISKSGNTYSYKDTKLGVGRDNSKEFLANDEKLYKELIKEIKK